MRKQILITLLLLTVCYSVRASLVQHQTDSFINLSVLRDYVDKFNAKDDELFATYIPNNRAFEFLSTNIPLFECPDKQLEEVYYFRWWTFRKHIRQTPEGYVITEFLPDVPWAGKYNAISCPGIHHFNEGRWLYNHNYLHEYARYWLKGGGSPRSYSFPIAYSMYNQYLVSGNDALIKELLPQLITNFEEWEAERYDTTRRLFWQMDDRDGMEVSISGSGYRATINSYMSAEAKAIAMISFLSRNEVSTLFADKAEQIKVNMLNALWDKEASFFKVRPRKENASLRDVRELHGYTPWCFNLVEDSCYACAWKFLMNPKHFYAPYGLTSAEQCHPGFRISYEGHECQWNGPSWPFATSVTLTGLANLLHHQQQPYITKSDYLELLRIYAQCHYRQKSDGTIVPWIDENLNPFTGDWISRTRLKNWKNGTWADEKGGMERGKDYNHSTFCDLIISGLVGLQPQTGNEFLICPLLPDGAWKYFCLQDVMYHGHKVSIIYDKTGQKYHKGKGLMVFVDNKLKASSPDLSSLKCTLLAQ